MPVEQYIIGKNIIIAIHSFRMIQRNYKEGIVIQTTMRSLTVLNYLTHSLKHKSKHSHDSKKRLRRKLLHEHLCEVLHTYMNAHRICILCSSEILRTHINKRHSPDATNCEKGFLQAVQEQLLLDLIYNVLHFSF